MTKGKKIVIILIMCIVLILIDQLSKILILNNTNIDNNVLIEYGTFSLQLEYNENMSFGLGSDNTYNLILALVVILIIILYIRKQIDNMDVKSVISIALILAGGIGNIIDRILRGAVIDFIKVGNFPVFNLADSFVVTGWFLFIIFLFIYFHKIEK